MAADGSIIIDSRINNKGAEADLKALQAKAKSTAQQISALDKELNAATGKRSKLAADMDSARAAAEQTAAALEKVNSQLNAARGATLKQVRQEYPRFSDAAVQDIAASRFRGDNAALLAEQARLTAELEKQDATIAAAAKAYAAQDAAVQRLTARHEGLQARLQQEQAALQMGVARTTVQAMYNTARRKIADCLVNGRVLRIEGGDVEVCERRAHCPRSGGCCTRKTCAKQKPEGE